MRPATNGDFYFGGIKKNKRTVTSCPNGTKIRPTVVDEVDDYDENAVGRKVHGSFVGDQRYR